MTRSEAWCGGRGAESGATNGSRHRVQGRSPWRFFCARHGEKVRGESPPRAEMTGTARLGKGAAVRRNLKEADAPEQGFDVQKPDTRLATRGNPAIDGDTPMSSRRLVNRSGEAPAKLSCLTLGDLQRCRTIPTIDPATGRDGPGEVSRGRSSRHVVTKGRTFLAKESVGEDSMDAQRQQGKFLQRLLFPEPLEILCHDTPGDGGPEAGVPEELQTSTASDPAQALTERISSGDTSSYKRERNRRIR